MRCFKLTIPAVTPEGLYLQDKRQRKWDETERRIEKAVERAYQWAAMQAEIRGEMDDESNEAPDLSEYKVWFTRSMLGWRWDATAPDGTEVPSMAPMTLRSYADRENAEAAALLAIKRHASPELPITGEKLRQQVTRRQNG